MTRQSAPGQSVFETTSPEGPIIVREDTPASAESLQANTETAGHRSSPVFVSDSNPDYQQTTREIDGPDNTTDVKTGLAVNNKHTTEIIFVDYRTPDAEAILDDIERNSAPDVHYELVALDADDAGIEIVSEYIARFSSIDAIHFISHGAEGTVQLGTDVFNEETLAAHASAVHQWQHYLSRDADILIYGCDVAATEHGQAFVDRLARMTGADVAASDDTTGSEELRADWQLEYTTGSVDSEIALSPALRNTLSATLASVVVETPASVSFDEDMTFVFSGSNAITVDGIRAPAVPYQVELNVANGILNLPDTTGITVVHGSNGSNSMTLEGVISDINVALDGLIYTPDTDVNGADVISVQVKAAADLLGHYTFDDGLTATDHAGGDNNGSLVGNATVINDPVRGNVLELDGDADAVQIAGDFGQSEDLTLATWVNLESVAGGDAEIIDVGHSAVIWYRAGGDLRGSYYDGSSWHNLESTIDLVASGWTHLAYTIDSTTNSQTLYINGIAVGSGNSTTPISYGNAPDTYLGTRADSVGDRDADGRLDDVRIYSRALSAAEVEALANDLTTASETVSISVNAVNDPPEFTVPGPSEFDSLAVATDANGANGTVTADMDSDGDDDIVAALTGSNTIVWYQNNADGSFTTQTVATGVLGVRQVGVADFDGDGDVDIVSASVDDNAIAWYESDGAGNFVPHLITNDALGAYDVAVGDLNGDGYSDVISASSNDNTVSWFAYDPGTGAFSAEQILSSTLDDVRTVEIADFNKDGHLDVLAGSGDGAINSIRLYTNDGNVSPTTFNGSFVAGGLGVVNGLAAADVNGDGILDVAVAETTGDKVAWYENDGSENFTRHEVASGVSGPQSVSAADIDDDGDIDLVVPVGENNTLVWYENDGVGGFNSHTLSNSLTDVTHASVVDINDDGDADIVVSVPGADSILIYDNISENLNERGVAQPVFIENGVPVVLAPTVEIFDTELDTVNSFENATLTLLRNGGANTDDEFGGSGNLVSIAGEVQLSGVAIGTFSNTAGQLNITFNASATTSLVNETLQSITYSNSSDAPPSIVQIDWTFNDGNTGAQGTGLLQSGNGNTNVVITPVNDPPSVTVPGSQTVTEDSEVAITAISIDDVDNSQATVRLTVNHGTLDVGLTGSVVISAGVNLSADLTLTGSLIDVNATLASLTYRPDRDFNGADTLAVLVTDTDGDTDTGNVAIMVNAANDTPLFSVSGPFEFDEQPIATGNDANGAVGTAVADLDDDGDVDIVAAQANNNAIVWYENNGDGSHSAHTLATGVTQVRQVDVADIDGDGDLDIVSASENDDTIAWYQNDGSRNFTANTITATAMRAYDVAVTDLDGDGDIDVLSASRNDDTIGWYANDGSGSFTGQVITSTLSDARSVTTADIDGDGDLDVVAGAGSSGPFAGTVRLFINDGSASFTETDVATGVGAVNDLAVVDLDNDGDLDIVAAEATADNVAWYENDGSESFTRNTIATGVDGPQSVAVADYDNDGDLDVIVPVQEEDSLVWFENDSNQNFTTHLINGSLDGATFAKATDIDGDGYTDVVVSARFADAILVFSKSESLAERGVGPLTFIEDGAPVVLAPTVELYDAELSDNDSFANAELTLARNGGANVDDVFEGSGNLVFDAGNIELSAVSIGTYTQSAGQLHIIFNSDATSIRVNEALQSIAYRNNSDTPPTAVEIDWLFNDGNTGSQGSGTALSATGDTSVNISETNDDPLNAGTSLSAVTVTEDDLTDIDLSSVDFSDADAGSGTLTVTLTTATGGSLTTAHNASLLFSGNETAREITGTLADLNSYFNLSGNIQYRHTLEHTAGNAADQISVIINDNGNTGAGGGNDQLLGVVNVNIEPVNDAPLLQLPDGIATLSIDTESAIPSDTARSVIHQSDGKILIGGSTGTGSAGDLLLTRLNADGTLDEDFGIGGVVTIDFAMGYDLQGIVQVQRYDGAPDKIIVAGKVSQGGEFRFGLARYTNDGMLDTSFGVNGYVITDVGGPDPRLESLAIQQSDNKIIAAGWTDISGERNFVVARYEADGALDTTFGGDATGIVNFDLGGFDVALDVALQNDGKIVMAGLSNANGTSDFAVARLTENGMLDADFSDDGIALTAIGTARDDATSLTIQEDGRIVLAGLSENGTGDEFALVRYNADGSLDTTFNSTGMVLGIVTTDFGYDTSVAFSVVAHDDKLIAVGQTDTASIVLRYNSDGTLDPGFGTGGILKLDLSEGQENYRDVSISSDGNIVAVGYADSDSSTDLSILGLIPDGTPDVGFDTEFQDDVIFVENGPAVVLDADFEVFDQEITPLDNFTGTSLSLERHGGANGEDILSFVEGAGITLTGTGLVKNGLVIGTLDTTTTPGRLVVTFTDTNGETPTGADVKAIARQITYTNISNNPPDSVQLDWLFSDGNGGAQGSGGALTVSGGTIVTITPLNDAPALIQTAIESVAAYDFKTGSDSIATAGPALTINNPVTISADDGFSTDSNGLLFPVGDNQSFTNPVSIGNIPGIAASNEFSFSAQVRFDAGEGLRQWERIFDFGSGRQQDNVVLARIADTQDLILQIYSGNTNSGEIIVPDALSAIEGEWHHYGVTIDSSGIARLYIDGASVGSHQLSLMPDFTTWDENYIGSSNWTNNRIFQGAMDDIAIFDRALHGSEMAALAGISNAQDFTIPENAVAGSSTGYVYGGDIDGDDLTYSIPAQEYIGAFVIDPNSGQITVSDSAQLNFEADNTHDVTIRVSDGALFDEDTYTITVNDVVEPQHNAIPINQFVDEDNVLTFSTANGNAITVVDGLASGDAMLLVRLDVSDGVLDLYDFTGITVFDGATGSRSISIVGTDTDINNALNGLTFTPNEHFNGVLSLDITTSAVNLDQLAGRYAFENAELLDSSPGTPQNGTFSGNATITTDPVRGEVLGLGGNGDSVEITGVFSEPESVTLSAWVNLTSVTGVAAEVISLGNNIQLRLDATGGVAGNGVSLAYRTSGGWQTTATGVFVEGTGWQHVAATFDRLNNVQTVYLNGSAIGTTNDSDPILYNQGVITLIGDHADRLANFDFTGQIDDARIYARALSADEIAEMVAPAEAITSVPITVRPVNDDPANSGSLPTDVTVTEDVLSPIGLSSLEIADIDANGGNITVALYTSTGGELTLTPDASLTFGGTATARTITGTIANLNDYLDNATNVQYLHATPNISGSNVDTITVAANDNGNSGTGGSGYVSLGVTNININGTNDTPALLQTGFESIAAYNFENGTASATTGGPPIVVNAPAAISIEDGFSTGKSGLLFPAGDSDSSTHPVSISSLPGLASSNEFSFGAQVRFDAGNGTRAWERIFDFGDGSVAKYVALTRLGSSNDLMLEVDNGTYAPDEIIVPDALVSIAGEWHHYGVTIDASGFARVYIDGVSVVSQRLSLLPDYTAFNNNYLGSSQFAGNKQFQGAMDDIAIFDRVLTSSEMDALANTATPQNFTVTENAVNGTLVATIHGGDVDGDVLTYSIQNHEHTGAFVIDSNTGEISVADSRQLDFETDGTHEIIVRASDGLLFDEETYTITLTDAAEVQLSVPLEEVFAEDDVWTFGNTVIIQDGLAAGDALLRVELGISDGVLDLSGLTGITVVGGADGSSSLTIVGTDTDINNALNGMTYTPDANYSGNVSLDVYSSVANLNQLAGRYTFEYGQATDVSAGPRLDGVFIGGAATVVDAVHGEVLSLDGNDDAVQIAGVFDEPENVTLSAWVNLTSVTGIGAEVVSLGNNLKLRMDDQGGGGGNGISLVYRNGGAWHTLSTGVFVAGTGWNHVAVTFDDANNRQTIYLNGSVISTSFENASVDYDLAMNTAIGAHGDGGSGYSFNGNIDDVRVYTRALSAVEIAELASPTDVIAPVATNLTEASGSVPIQVTAVNDDPYNAGSLPADITVTEDTPSNIDLSLVDFRDLDAGTNNLTVTLSTATGGQLTLAPNAALAFSGTATDRSITGTLTDLNAYFGNASNIRYLHGTAHINGDNADTITVTITDNGNIGTGGGTEQMLGTVNVDISALNDEQTVVTISTAIVSEGSIGNVISPALLETTDVDHPPTQLIYSVNTSPDNGTLLLNGVALAVNDTFTQADINSGLLTYDHEGSQTSSDRFTFSVDDGVGTASTGTFSIAINNINDAPVNTVPSSPESIDEDTPQAITNLSVADDDDNLDSVRLTVINGTLTVTLSGATSIASGANGSSDLTIVGPLPDINDTLATLTYVGIPNFSGSDTLTILSTDNSTSADSDAVNITVNPINDDPFNAGSLPANVSVTEDLLSGINLSSIDVGDVDAGVNDVTVRLSTSAGGELTLAADAGLTFGGTATNGTISGSITALNSYFNYPGNIQYLHSTDHVNGDIADSIAVSISDNGNTGVGGGTEIPLGTVSVDITAVNDEQLLASNLGTTVAEGSTGNAITQALLQTTDVDHAPGQLIYTLNAVPVSGSLLLSGVALAVNDTFTQADIDAVMLTYDHDGSQTASDAFGFSVDDGIGTVSSGTFDITVTNVNDAPVSSVPGPLDIDEDMPLAISGISVTDDDDNLSTVRLTVDNGRLSVTLSGAASVSAGTNGSADLTLAGSLDDINDSLASLIYRSDLHYQGSDTLTILSTDDSSATRTDIVNITVNPVNDDPINTGTLVSNVSVTEDIQSDIDLSAVDFHDIDAANVDLTVTVSTATGGKLTLAADAALVFDGTPTARIISGSLNDLNVYFNNPGNIRYLHNTTDINGDNTDSISVTIRDNGNTGSGGGTDILLGTVNVDIAAVNDEQLLVSNIGTTVAEGSTGNAITQVLLKTTDVDHVPVQLIYTLNTVPASGTLLLNGVALAVNDTFTQADIDAGVIIYDHDGSQTASDNFAFSVDDGTGTVSSGTFDITVTNVNDAPVSSVPGPLNVDEDMPLTINGITVSDDDDNLSTVRLMVDNGTLSITLSGTAAVSAGSNGSSDLTLAGSLDDINESLASLIYQGNLHFYGADTLTIVATDDSSATVSDNVNITVNPVNNDPVNLGTLPSVVTVNEDLLSDVDLSVIELSDIDAGSSDVTMSLSTSTGGQLTLAADAGLIFAGTPTDRTITGPLSDLNAYLNNPGHIQYLHSTHHINGDNADSITVSISDNGNTGIGGGTEIPLGTVSVDIAAVNDEQLIATNISTTVAEGSTGNAITQALLQTTDVDDTPGQLIYTLNAVPASGNLLLNGAALAVSDTVTQADINTGLLTYDHDGSQTASDTFGFYVDDGTGTISSGMFDITVTNVNDAPVSSVPGPLTVDEDTPLAITGISVSDDDDNLSTVRLRVDNGTLSVTLNGAASVSAGSNGSADLTLAGSLTDINDTLASLRYQGNLHFNGADTLTILTTDSSSAMVSDVVNITANPVNDDPVNIGALPTSVTVIEDILSDVDLSAVSFSDVDAGNSNITVTLSTSTGGELTLSPASGLIFDGSALARTITGTLTDLNTYFNNPGNIQYLHGSSNINGDNADSITITITDNIGIQHGRDQIVGVINVEIAPVNDPPTGTDRSVTLLEDSAYTITLTDFGFIDTIDNHSMAGIQIDTLPTEGTLTLSGNVLTNSQVVSTTDIVDGKLVFMPQANTSGSAYDKLLLRVLDNGGTVHGGIDTAHDINTLSFTVISVNDAPSGEDSTVSVTEDIPYVLSPADFGFSDPIDNDDFRAITVVTTPEIGVLYNRGAPIIAESVIDISDIEAGRLQYIPALDASDSSQHGFTFRVHDTGGDDNGGLSYSQSDYLIRFDLLGVNDPPSLHTTSLIVDEGRSVVLSTEAIHATDVDDRGPDDLQFVLTSLPINGTVSLDGAVAVAGATFSAEDLRSALLRYTHDGSETATDHFDIQVSDGGEDGAQPASARQNITINEVIDPAPIVEDESITLPYGQSFNTIDGDLLESGFTSLAARLITLDPDLVVSLETEPLHGKVTISADGAFAYTHDGNALLQDHFQYRVTNLDGEYTIANVNVTVEPPLEFAIEQKGKVGQALSPVTRQTEPATAPQQSVHVTAVTAANEPLVNELQAAFAEPAPTAILSSAEESDQVALFDNTEQLNQLALVREYLDDTQTVVQHNEQVTLSLPDEIGSVSIDFNSELTPLDLELDSARKITSSQKFNDALWQIDKNLTEAEERQNRRYQIASNTTLGVSLGLTAGIFSWFFRGGALFASVVASTPLWSYIDPVSIITKKDADKRGRQRNEGENDELEKYFDGRR